MSDGQPKGLDIACPVPSRDRVFQDVTDKHARRMSAAVRAILAEDSVLGARTKLERAVRALPGVSADPDTVPDILRLMDIYNAAVRELSTDN